MASTLIFSNRALADLNRLHVFLATKSPRAAARAIARIVEGLDLLLLFPRAGVVVRRDIRQHFIRFGRSAYIVRYRLAGDDVIVLRIWHGREDRPR